MAYHPDGTTCSFAEEYEQDVLELEKQIQKLKEELKINSEKIRKLRDCSVNFFDARDYGACMTCKKELKKVLIEINEL
jgi:hypothetical protein